MKILLAVDGSPESQRAIQAVALRSLPAGSLVRVLSVWQTAAPISTHDEAIGGTAVAQLAAQLESEARRVVAEAATELRAAGLVVEARVRRGDPRGEIVDEAAESGCDLVVVGSHGRTGIGRWLLGSVAEYVVRHAPCSVEVARAVRPAPAAPANGS